MQLSMPLMNLSTLVTDYKKCGASQRIYEIMQEPVEPMEQLKPIANINIENGALEFNNVEFKYDVKRFLIMYHFVYLRVTLVLLLVLQVLGKVLF